jgi:DNA-binding PadR family transcriptional regulator
MFKLGEFEQLVLIATLDLGAAYGGMVTEAIQRSDKRYRDLSLAAVHTTLYRLEEKGLLTSYYGDPTPERGGRRKRFFKVNARGKRALSATQVSREAFLEKTARVLSSHGLLDPG